MSELTLRSMRASDAEQVAILFRLAFPVALQKFMVYGQVGLPNYLRDLCSYPNLFPQFRFVVAVDKQGRIVGFTEFRIPTSTSGFLSNIFLSEDVRGKGLGSRMIQHFLDDHPSISHIELDVFDSNPGARRLYRKLGFKEQKASYWFAQSVDVTDPASEVDVTVSLSSVAMHSRYGFSEFTVSNAYQEIRFGRIGDSVLRVYEPQHLNAAIIAGIKKTFPSIDTTFVIRPSQEREWGNCLDVSWRMAWDMKPKSGPFAKGRL